MRYDEFVTSGDVFRFRTDEDNFHKHEKKDPIGYDSLLEAIKPEREKKFNNYPYFDYSTLIKKDPHSGTFNTFKVAQFESKKTGCDLESSYMKMSMPKLNYNHQHDVFYGKNIDMDLFMF